MAQSGFQLSDDAKTITILNDSGTTAITAGDIVYSGVNNDVLTGTAASARNAYAPQSDIKGFSILASATGYQTVIGVALEDIPTASVGAIALEGIFIHAVNSDTEAGNVLQGDAAAANKVDVLADATTTVGKDIVQNKIGRALSGGSASGS